MRRLGVVFSLALLTVAACSGDAISAANGTTTTVSPTDPASACTQLVRCSDAAQPRIAAAVCGGLERDNAFVVSTGTLEVGDAAVCARTPNVDALVQSTIAAGTVDGDGVLSLGCDRYRFGSLGVDNTLQITVTGDAVIVVDGDVRIAAPTNIDVAPGARLDFVIAGNLEIDNTLTIQGGTTWLAVAGSVRIASPTKIAGWLVAPSGPVEADNTLVVDALVAGSLRVGSAVTVTGALGVTADGCAAL